MLTSAENKCNGAVIFDISKKLLNSLQTSGNGFCDNRRFSKYKRSRNCPNIKQKSITEKC